MPGPVAGDPFPGEQQNEHRHAGQHNEHSTPAEPDERHPTQHQRTEYHTQRACEGPACHILFVAGWVGVHQCGLRESDESPRGGIEDDQGEEQDGKGGAESGQQAGQGKENAATQDEHTPLPDIPKDTQEWLDNPRKDAGDGKQQADLDIV